MKPANQDQTVYLFSINNLEKTGQNVKQQRIDKFVKCFVLCCWGVLRCGGSVVFVCCCATLTGAVLLWRWKEKQAAHCLKLPGKTRLRLSKVHATMPWPAPHATCTLRIFAQFFWLIGLVLSVLFFSRKSHKLRGKGRLEQTCSTQRRGNGHVGSGIWAQRKQ